MNLAGQLATQVTTRAACAALGVATSTYYRKQRPAPARRHGPRKPNPRRIPEPERQQIRDTLNSERFMDKAPGQVFAILAEQGQCIGSERTMYRVLDEVGQVQQRRARRTHPKHAIPQLVARGPNEVWSWDITKLRGEAKGISYALYLVLDLFSRYAVGWLLSRYENAELAKKLLRETVAKYDVAPGQLTVHNDRGSPMRAHKTVELLDSLGVKRSYSRPRVSNDNPFSESQFATMKARPEIPERIGSEQHGRQVIREILHWYNYEHRHSGIAMLTPAQVHFGLADDALAIRHAAKLDYYDKHPERFINGRPRRELIPAEVWINPPQTATEPMATGH